MYKVRFFVCLFKKETIKKSSGYNKIIFCVLTAAISIVDFKSILVLTYIR